MTEHPLPTPDDDATLTGPQTPTPQRVAAVRALRELLAACLLYTSPSPRDRG